MTSLNMKDFYARLSNIYNNSELSDTDRRTFVFNMCIRQWQTKFTNHDNEPLASTINEDGTFKPRAFDIYRSTMTGDILMIKKSWLALSPKQRKVYGDDLTSK
jgi:hypothetical protein